jgi:hypothetical protein
MKKGATLILLIIILIPLVNSIEYTCSDPSDLKEDTEEIKEGEKDSLRGLTVGICGAIENSFEKWIESEVFIDANVVTIVGNATLGTELRSGNSTVSFTQPSSEKIKIDVGGTKEEIEINDCLTINDHAVMLVDISGTGAQATAKILIADEKITLNTQSNPGQIIESNAKKYALQLLTGSSLQSTIKVSTCGEGEITQLMTPQITNSTNSTNQETNITNSTTEQNITIQNNTNESKTGDKQREGFIEPKVKKPNIFARFWGWIKSLFG